MHSCNSQPRFHPCPCGFFGDGQRDCRCSTTQVQKYRQRISGPLLDRIDIHVEAPAVRFKEMASSETSEPSAEILKRVEAARQVQSTRFADSATGCNARMTPKQIKAHCALPADALELLKMAMTSLQLSARAYDRILKVSRTIADLDHSESITTVHISEAIQYRTLDRSLW